MTDLEQLSREAAKALPKEWRLSGMIHTPSGHWCVVDALTVDTEACAEIMVRVLWPQHICIEGCGTGGLFACAYDINGAAIDSTRCEDGDPLQAFRTAVLRALIEVKK